MQPVVRIRLLGQFQAVFGGVDVASLGSARLQSLLAYLLLHRDAPQPRQRLASALWPDSSEAQAMTNLRHLLHTLRRCVPDAQRYLEITSRTVRWRPEAAVWLDVGAFEDFLATEGRGEARRAALREAVELYARDLMDGCGDEWLVSERDRLRRRHLDALAELAQLCEARGELDEAIRYAEQLLRLDELREDVHRQLMRLHAGRGDRASAIRVFHLCSTTLERELGVAPSAATRSAYQALLASERSEPTGQPERTAGPPLVGRSAERARLAAALRSAQARTALLVVVTGEAGVGKSRLVEEFRRSFVRTGGAACEARCYPAEGPLAYGPVVALTFGVLLAVDMSDEPGVREWTARLVTHSQDWMNDNVTRGFQGYVAVLDGDVDRGLAEVRASVEHACHSPSAPGQHAMLLRVLLAACLAAGYRDAALATADRLLAMSGPARLWAPVARLVRAELARSG